MQDIRTAICATRKRRIAQNGYAQGLDLPAERAIPPEPFASDAMPICEIKRKSPSRGDIAPGLDPVAQAAAYRHGGITRVSVLTEEDHFGGSLSDLVAVKRAFPGLSLLRKDFLFDEDDVRVSFRAGADAILLIAGMLEPSVLSRMHVLARNLGMESLVELHDSDDVEKTRALRPPLVGINARDLSTFRMDALLPLKLRNSIDWPCRIVYESGVLCANDAMFVSGTGFHGALVGEGAVRNPDLVTQLALAFGEGKKEARRLFGFWRTLYERGSIGRPLVKICGITRQADAEKAVSLGADALGFVFAPSPRRADTRAMGDFRGIDAIKVGVVCLGPGMEIPDEIERLLRDGLIDAIQFHGSEDPGTVSRYPGYKAITLADSASLDLMDRYHSPAVLVDAYAPGKAGGTGTRVPDSLVSEVSARRELWLAGGLSPETVRDAIVRHKPGLVDASSGLESAPGLKDHDKLESYFKEIRHAVS